MIRLKISIKSEKQSLLPSSIYLVGSCLSPLGWTEGDRTFLSEQRSIWPLPLCVSYTTQNIKISHRSLVQEGNKSTIPILLCLTFSDRRCRRNNFQRTNCHIYFCSLETRSPPSSVASSSTPQIVNLSEMGWGVGLQRRPRIGLLWNKKYL